jgi:TolB-like protein/DNA-binding winged helix-turn-helix (wHTH) protein/tetratricopeptide (TPR) repeat protein
MSTARIQTKFRIGEWIANPASNLLERKGESIRLESRAMDVLAYLASRHGAVTSVDELMTAVWKGVVVGDGSVYLAISQLRQALGGADGKTYIETVPKRGYQLAVPAELIAVEATHSSAVTGPRRSWRIAALLAGIIATAGGLAWILRPTASVQSIAVLPFADLSPEGKQAYFADGVTVEILNRLAGIRDLRVIGRNSSFQLRGQGADSRALGNKLDVDHLLVGSVRKEGDRVRVTAQLASARTGEQLWSQTYERRLNDIFAIQDEIATAVAAAMQVKLRVGETSRIPGMTRDVAAYDEYLRGMALNIQMRPETFPRAIAHLQRAVAIDPAFSLAWSGLHTVFSNGAYAVPERAAEWRRAAGEALEQARRLAPDAPHVLLELGISAVRAGHWLEGAEFFQRLEKSYAEHQMPGEYAGPRGALLLAVGRIEEAIRSLEDARAHDPLAPAYAAFLSQAYVAKRDFQSAFAEIDRGLKLEGLRGNLLNAGLGVALSSGDHGEIERRLAAITDDTPNAHVHRRLAQFLGKPEAVASEIRTQMLSADDSEKVALAVWGAYYSEPVLALEILVEVIPRRGHPGILWIPLFADSRALQGFGELVKSLGIADYWRVHAFADFCEQVNQEQVECH